METNKYTNTLHVQKLQTAYRPVLYTYGRNGIPLNTSMQRVSLSKAYGLTYENTRF